MRSRLRVEGLKEAVQRIDVVGDRGRRPEPALRANRTLQDLTASERRRFDSQRGWKRDTPAWIREKRRRGLDSRTLRATGRLERSLTSGAGLTFKAFNGTLSWGIPRGRSDLYYAQALAKGTSSTPARRMVVIDKTAKDRISIRVERYVAYGEVS
jgi:hypothetical protein